MLEKERALKKIEITPQLLRQMQLIQLEILLEVDRVCRKHAIPYSIDGGTLLGAVRHKGFIPWDDDIDVIMLRDDYERFFQLSRSEQELDTKRFFLQEHRTDSGYRVGYTRIRRNNTVYQRAGHEHMNYHQGVFIDIFILDNVPNNKILRVLHRTACFINRKILWSESGKHIAKNALWRSWFAIVSLIPAEWAFRSNDAIARLCNRRNTNLIRHNTHPYPNPKVCGYGIPSELMRSFTEIEFEGHPFMAVSEYEQYLTLLYVDYMTLPPEEKQKPHIRLSAFEPVSMETE